LTNFEHTKTVSHGIRPRKVIQSAGAV
jgi:hypothetical protein